jgi:antitoxin VapB
MSKVYPARSFKSGNSVAIRMPAELGIEPGHDWVVESRDGKLVLEPKPQAKRKFDIEKVWGCARGSGLRFVEDRNFEPRPSEIDDQP